MTPMGADRTAIDGFAGLIRPRAPAPTAIKEARVPEPPAGFTTASWEFIGTRLLHCQAAAFAFGRENLIPGTFGKVAAVNRDLSNRFANFRGLCGTPYPC